RRQPKQAGGAGLGQDHSPQAKRLAAAILEVLAGLRTPAQAAAALGMSLLRYYHCEGQALRGLLAACEARPPGRRRPADRELAALRQQQQRQVHGAPLVVKTDNGPAFGSAALLALG